MRRQFSPFVQCFDASEDGVGIVEREVELSVVSRIAAYDDRWRFRWGLYEGANPRENSPWQLGWADPESVKPIRPRPEGWRVDLSFPEVPTETLQGPWKTCVSKRWRDRESIFLLEARAGILGLRRAVRRLEGAAQASCPRW